MAWDKDGDLLAALCEKMPIVILWDSNRRKLTQIDSSFKYYFQEIIYLKAFSKINF